MFCAWGVGVGICGIGAGGIGGDEGIGGVGDEGVGVGGVCCGIAGVCGVDVGIGCSYIESLASSITVLYSYVPYSTEYNIGLMGSSFSFTFDKNALHDCESGLNGF